MQFVYRAYGLRCASNVDIPGFTEDSNPQLVDLSITLTPAPPQWVVAAKALPKRVSFTQPRAGGSDDSGYSLNTLGAEDFFEFSYSDGASFLVDATGVLVWGNRPPHLSLDYLATYLRGPIMGFVLRRRGLLALHASTLNIDGRAVLLCGESESGKSTTTSAFALAGTPVLSEDITAVTVAHDLPYAQPGYPQIGLWPDAVTILMGSHDALPRFTAGWEKRFLDLRQTRGGFDSAPRPMAAIYMLDSRVNEVSAPRVTQLDTQQAFLALVQNTYMNWLLTADQRRIEFDLLAKVSATIPIRRIVPHVDPTRLPALCQLIVDDSRALMNSQSDLACVR